MNRDSSATSESVFIAPAPVSAAVLAGSLQALLPTRSSPIRQRFTVLDTFDGRVRRAGGRLTRTGRAEASIVTWQAPDNRTRLTVPLPQRADFAWDLPAGPLQEALRPVIGVRRLLEQLDAETSGSLLEVLDARGKTVARLRIESGRARAARVGGGWQPLPTMVTLTALRGFEPVYERLMPIVESRPGITACPQGFYGVALHQTGVGEHGAALAPPDLSPMMPAAVGARQSLLPLLRVLETNEPGLRANLDTEFLHDFRVAVRRTRSLLGQIKGVFSSEAVERFSTDFSWMGRLTGPPRDLDVLVLALRAQRDEVAAGDLEAVTAFLDRERQREHEGLIAALDSQRYRQLLAEWESFLVGPVRVDPEPENAGRSFAVVIARRAWRLSRRIARAARTIDEHTAPACVHDVRIIAKKLRYLVDVAPGFFDPHDFEGVLSVLKRLQRVLGHFNDAEVQEARLLDHGRALGDAGGPPGAVLALGQLAERSRQRRESLRPQVIGELQRFRARETRMACRRAFKRSWDAEASR